MAEEPRDLVITGRNGGGGGGVCSICQDAVQPGEPSRTCESCQATFHSECYQHNAGCGTYGCDHAPDTLKVYVSGEQETGAWGDAKYCPNCNELIESRALKCSKCKAAFDTRAPMTPEEYHAQLERKRIAKRTTWMAIILFVLSAFGVLAPATLVASGLMIFSRKDLGRRAAGVAELLAYAAAAVSLAYLILMIAIFGFGF
ncbi:MAG: hypothetical protein IID45_07385 [Planctomycetes bacterium]|nr:hypothetical protein [Planctomycetota bacterium]